jgi:hypothetical protein
MFTPVIFLGSLILGVIFLYASSHILRSPSLMRSNYRGIEVPTSAGVIFAPVFLVTWSGIHVVLSQRAWYSDPQSHVSAISLSTGMNAMLVLVLGMCLAGLLDDVSGGREARGFKGHFGEALHGRFTTGFFKALVGFLVALAATAQFSQQVIVGAAPYGQWLLDAALVALTANLFNLMDLRPGRALKVFFPLMVLTVALTARLEALAGGATALQPVNAYLAPAVSVVAVALVLFPGDLREKFMIGDAGSNVIGAVVGLGLVLGLDFWWRLGVLVFLVLLTALSEKISFSRVIEGNRMLNWLDQLGRQRRESPGGKL